MDLEIIDRHGNMPNPQWLGRDLQRIGTEEIVNVVGYSLEYNEWLVVCQHHEDVGNTFSIPLNIFVQDYSIIAQAG